MGETSLVQNTYFREWARGRNRLGEQETEVKQDWCPALEATA